MEPNQTVSALKFDGLREELSKTTGWESRIKSTLRALEDELSFQEIVEEKSNRKSSYLRKEADLLIVKNKGRNEVLLEAREMYTKSIAYAEPTSTEWAKACANRSSALFHLYKYKECIRDIDRALESSYPDHLRPNLLRRKAKCLKKLGDKAAEDVCEEARCLLENVSLSDEKKERLEININNATKVPEHRDPEETSNKLPNFVPHPHIPSASEAIDLKYDKDIGRHYVANRDIKTGEILIDEKLYVSFLSIPNIYTYCSHCLVRIWDGIPCEQCVYAVYCSQKCKKTAWRQYHDIVCSVEKYFIALKLDSTVTFALKLTLLALRESGSIKQLQKELNEIDNCEDDLIKMFSNDGIIHSDRYRPLYSLLTHENNRDCHEILSLSLNTATVLSYVNKYSNLLSGTDKSISTLCDNEDALFFGKLHTENYMKIQLNSHEFGELNLYKFHKLGAIVGPIISFLNHSCVPNVSKCLVFKDEAVHQIYFALHPISKGSQILDDYGCNFIYEPKSEREKFTSFYYFKCNCKACIECWPLLQFLPSVFKCIDSKIERVEVARLLVYSTMWEKEICKVDFMVSNKNSMKIMNDVTRSITKMYETTKKPNKTFYETVELLKLAFFKYYAIKFEL